jgi:ribulose-phosphate 3-epimerase
LNLQIAPSILNANFADLRSELAKINEADWLHLDIMDGHFVPNLTFGPPVVAMLRSVTTLPMDAHLMVDNPEELIPAFAEAGVERITVHVESTKHIHRLIQQIKAAGCSAGVALNPGTPLDSLDYILSELSLVMLMTVNPGFGGQKFIPEVLPKISLLRGKLDKEGFSCDIGVDGGINLETAREVIKAGANHLVAGTLIYKATDPAGMIKKLRVIAQGEA